MNPKLWPAFLESVGFEARTPQTELVEAIIETLEDSEQSFLIADAGTGTGKSAAASVPGIALAKQTGKPIIISTATKNLQGQYFKVDLPMITGAFPLDLLPPRERSVPSFAILKGKGNYLCTAKVKEQGNGFASKYQLPLSPADGETGDVASLRLPPKIRPLVTISSNDCPGATKCQSAEAGDCFFEAAKEKAFKANVLVVNHALLAIDALLRQITDGAVQILPEPSAVMIDEAHKFEDYVRGALGWTLTREQLYRWANDCLQDDADNEDFKELVKELWEGLARARKSQTAKERKKQEDSQVLLPPAEAQKLKPIKDMMRLAERAVIQGEDEKEYKRASRSANMARLLGSMLIAGTDDNFWTEKDRDGEVSLNYKPRSVANFLRANFWPYTGAGAVLMSATPPHAPSKRLGIPDEQMDTLRVTSPFDYAKQAALYIDRRPQPEFGAAYPEVAEYLKGRSNDMFNLVAASDGRALLLFTSWKDLNETFDMLAPRFAEAGVTVLRQERENAGERERLAKTFKEDEHSVLFGTESFFEGVDIPGRSLQLVVINKLPFPSMYDATRGGKLDFMQDMMPEMTIKLTQAAGRLIRSTSDRGMVAIFDPRLLTKGYGRQLLNKVPFKQMKAIRSIPEAMEYLEALEEE